MKITSSIQSLLYSGQRTTANKGPSSQKMGQTGSKNFDEIVIQKKETVDEEQFIRELQAQIKREVSTSTSNRNLEEIKMQVQSDSYQIGVEDIVRRMMY